MDDILYFSSNLVLSVEAAPQTKEQKNIKIAQKETVNSHSVH